MSTKQTYEVSLPEGMRLLTPTERRAVHAAVREAARRHGVGTVAADEISYDALAAAGVFLPPDAPDPDMCTARYLPHWPEEAAGGMLGVWQQCADEPGHDGTDHDSGEFCWSDGDTGTLPALPAEDA